MIFLVLNRFFFVVYLMVAAEWNTMSTFSAKNVLSVSLSPNCGSVTSPSTILIFLKRLGSFSRIRSKTGFCSISFKRCSDARPRFERSSIWMVLMPLQLLSSFSRSAFPKKPEAPVTKTVELL